MSDRSIEFFNRAFDASVFVRYCGDRHADADLRFSGKDKHELAACRYCLDYEIQLRKLEPRNPAQIVDSETKCGKESDTELLYLAAKTFELDDLLSAPGPTEEMPVNSLVERFDVEPFSDFSAK